MENSKVLIIVEGGIVQSVHSNDKDLKFVVVDYDDHSDEPIIIGELSSPESVIEKLHKLDGLEPQVKKNLKDLDF